MKKIALVMGILLISLTSLFAQSGDTSLITVKKSDIPANLLQKLDQQNKLQDIKQKMDTVKKMASTGKEIGIAINDGLKAVTDQTIRFSNTPVGKFTMFLIAWKVMAADSKDIAHGILGVLFGIPFIIFFDLLLLGIYRRTVNKRRVLVEEGDTKDTRKYQYMDTWFTENDEEGNNNENVRVAFMICYWIIFSIGNLWIIAGVIF